MFAPGGGAGEGGGGQGAAAAEPRCIDLPTQSGAAQLQLLYPPRQPDASLLGDTAAPPFRMPSPEVFAVLSPSGIYYGQLDLDPSIPDPSDHLVKHQLLPAAVLHLPPGGGNGGAAAAAAAAAAADTPGERPLSLVRGCGLGRTLYCFALACCCRWRHLAGLHPTGIPSSHPSFPPGRPQAMTQHHFVLLYPSKLQWVNRVSKAAVQELPLQRFATPVRGAATMPLGLCRDQLAGRIYVLAGGR